MADYSARRLLAFQASLTTCSDIHIPPLRPQNKSDIQICQQYMDNFNQCSADARLM